MKKLMKNLQTVILICLLLFLFSACGKPDTPIPVKDKNEYWPTNGWRSASPEDHGLDNEQLEAMFAYIEKHGINLHSLLIVKDGYIVAEQYYSGFDQNTPHVQYSVTKSFVSSLVGIAMEEGHISSVDQKVLDVFPELTINRNDPQKAGMTIEDILTMRTGLDWTEGDTGYYALMESANPTAYMLSLPLVDEPGTDFRYCSGCSYLLSAIIQESTETNTLTFAETKLFEPLGITSFTWEKLQNGVPNGGWGLHLTPRQMAKFGYLYLNNGVWDGQQVVPQSWIKASIQPGNPASPYTDYGYQWWIYPDLNIYAAQGLYGQKIYVIPENDMVVVMTAELYDESQEFLLLQEFILTAVQEQ